MAITPFPPNTIKLSGPSVEQNDLPAGGTITPGMLVETYDSGAGVPKVRAHATAAGNALLKIAVNASMLNKGIDDNYAAADFVETEIPTRGAKFYVCVPSGQVLAPGDFLESDGAGKFRKQASTGVRLMQCDEALTNGATTTSRIRATAL